MRVALVTSGSRGDIRPFLALANRLRRAHHEVRFVAHTSCQPMVEGTGTAFLRLGGDPAALSATEDGQTLHFSKNPLRREAAASRLATRHFAAMVDGCRTAFAGVDHVIFGIGALIAGDVAQSLGIPATPACIQPMTPTTAFPAFPLTEYCASLGAPLNWLSHVAMDRLLWRRIRHAVCDVRRDLGLPEADRAGLFAGYRAERRAVLFAYSPHLVPQGGRWPDRHFVTGFWREPDPPAAPTPDLAAFVEREPRAIYVGFGSSADPDPEGLRRAVDGAIARTGLRAVVLRGRMRLGDAADTTTTLQADYLPFGWLFPRVRATVHHGGAGTCAEGLLSGTPSVIVPYGADNPFWARRLAQHDAGVVLRRKGLNASSLADALRHVTTSRTLRDGAAALGAHLAREDGVGAAISLLEAGRLS